MVTFNSEPSGAKVKVGGLKGTTPYTVDFVASGAAYGLNPTNVDVELEKK